MCVCVSVGAYVYYCRTYEKAVSGGGEREKGGHVLRDTTSRGLYVRVWPPHTSERRGYEGNHMYQPTSLSRPRCCLLLQDLYESCARGGE